MRNGNRAVRTPASDCRSMMASVAGDRRLDLVPAGDRVVNLAIWLWAGLHCGGSARCGPERRATAGVSCCSRRCSWCGCAFRSILPRADVQRICLFDSWLSSVLIGRSVATVAELAFMAQWALLLGERRAPRGSETWPRVGARVLVPIIAVAEVCSWYAVLTTNFIGNAMEQSIWTFASALVMVGLLSRERAGRDSRSCRPRPRSSVPTSCSCRSVDVPMYFRRWRADERAGDRTCRS